MTYPNKLLSPLFLNEKEIRKLIELMYFSYHDFVEISDQMLEKIQFSKTHYRIIYFLGKNDFITIKELLSILKITKQSISRIINQLVKEKYIILSTGSDKRTKKLTLTEKGMKLEKKLTELQITKIRNIRSRQESRKKPNKSSRGPPMFPINDGS